ncbi:MAG: ATP-binding protein [Prevotellaceae bacterium]|nr:ATP-binding protein [Prevotellaceae bacterium]
MKETKIEAKVGNLEAVQNFISEVLKAASDCPAKLQRQIILAVEEIFVNIALYAYSQNVWATSSQNKQPVAEAGIVTIRIAVSDEIIIEFMDSGIPFNPLEIDEPNLTSSTEEREIGGLGIFMVKNLMDTIKYRNEDNKNILILAKKVAKYSYPLNFPVGEVRW